MNAKMDTNDACDLRFGQVGIACVRVRRVDAAALCDELERRVRAAPQMFARAAVVLDLSHLLNLPDDGSVDALLEAVRSAGMLPVGLAYGTSETEVLAKRMGLPLIAKFRAAYEPANATATVADTPSRAEPVAQIRPEPILSAPTAGSRGPGASPGTTSSPTSSTRSRSCANFSRRRWGRPYSRTVASRSRGRRVWAT